MSDKNIEIIEMDFSNKKKKYWMYYNFNELLYDSILDWKNKKISNEELINEFYDKIENIMKVYFSSKSQLKGFYQGMTSITDTVNTFTEKEIHRLLKGMK